MINPYSIDISQTQHDAHLIFAMEENSTGVFKCIKNAYAIKDIERVDKGTVNRFLQSKGIKVLVLDKPRHNGLLKDPQRKGIARNFI